MGLRSPAGHKLGTLWFMVDAVAPSAPLFMSLKQLIQENVVK